MVEMKRQVEINLELLTERSSDSFQRTPLPAKVFENVRPTVMAGLAMLVELLKK